MPPSDSAHGWMKRVIRPGATFGFIALAVTLAAQHAFAATTPTPAVNDILIVGGVNGGGNAQSSAEFYVPSKRKFFTTSSMNSARAGLQAQWVHSSSERAINEGAAIGGFTGSAGISGNTLTFDISTLDSVESYQLPSQTFVASTATMSNGRAFSSSIAWPGNVSSASNRDSHLLVWGGLCNASSLASCRTASLVHPDDNPADVTATSNPKVATMFNQLTHLSDDTVLDSGGFGDFSGGTLSDAEIFSPSNDGITGLGNAMTSQRAGHSATLLPDGTVLVVGGMVNSSGTLNASKTAEIYDPNSQTFTALNSTLIQARAFHTAMLLRNGKVLIAGGFDGSGTMSLSGSNSGVTGTLTMASGEILDTAEIYNPHTKTFKCVGPLNKKTGVCKSKMNSSRIFAGASALKTGGILLTGGFGASKGGGAGVLDTAELFTGQFHKVGNMNDPRAMHGSMRILP